MERSYNDFKTSAAKAYTIIRDRIVQGNFAPGERLTRRTMAKVTGVSIVPVIEALHKLEDEGLVVSEPHFGARVIALDDNTIRDRFALRMAIECQVVRILALHQFDEHVGRLSFLARELDATPRTEDRGGVFWTRHFSFHLRMAEFTHCPSFVRELTSLNLFDILRRSVSNLPDGARTPVPKQHHERIVLGIATGDADHAEKIMREHINYSHLLTEEQF